MSRTQLSRTRLIRPARRTRPTGTTRPAGLAARLRALVGLLAALVLVAGCAQLPQSSPVATSSALEDSQDNEYQFTYSPPPPAEGASPEEVISSYLNAGSGPRDDYASARAHLTTQAAEQWDADGRTIVYSDSPQIVPTGEEGHYTVYVEVESIIDENGVRVRMAPGTSQALDVSLVQENGEWRIENPRNGTLLSSSQFSGVFSPHALYFYDRTYRYAVPDVRWFVNRQSTPTDIVVALLNGPSTYLEGAVVSAFTSGPGSTLTRPSVPVSAGVAQVDLTPAAVEGADAAQQERMREQLSLALDGLTGVNEVELSVDSDPLGAASSQTDVTPVVVDPSRGSMQIGVDDSGSLMTLQGTSVTHIGGLPEVSDLDPQDPTMTVDRQTVAFLDGTGTALHVARTDGTQTEPITGDDLTRPSIDGLGWAWTVDRTGGENQILAVPVDTQPKNGETARTEESVQPRIITAEALEPTDRRIVDFRMSVDGTRAAIILERDGVNSLWLAGVIRDSDGVPSALSSLKLLDTSVPLSTVAWVNDQQLLVADIAEDPAERIEPQIVHLDGSRTTLTALSGIVGVSASTLGNRYAETGEGIYLLVGSSWAGQSVDGTIRDIAFPG